MANQRWPHQQRGIDQFWAAFDSGKKRICITAPTGGGKTFMTSEIIKEAQRRGLKTVFHVNRRSLAEQTRKSFESYYIDSGMRASGYKTDFKKPSQISMTPTESSRIAKGGTDWWLHDADIVFIDEAHGEKTHRILELIKKYEERKPGTVFCGLTATPLDIGHIYDTLIVAGANSELRACGAHLPCKEFVPTMPDVLRMKRKADGEYSERDVEKKMKPAVVFGHILPHHLKLNPLLKPAILFAPSVAASITITDMYLNAGIRAAHIDAKNIYYGEKDSNGLSVMEDSTKTRNREKLFDEVRSGEVQAVSNRFILTEGIDLPQVYHLILATSFGSLTMFLQACGRVLRNHDSIDHVILQDHGGSALIHGSVNDDREWSLEDTAKKLRDKTVKDRQEGKSEEPIVCPKCGAMRLSGGTCFECGHRHTMSGISILEEDGTLRQMQGPYVKRKEKGSSDAVKAWFNTYFPCSKSKSHQAMTWRQMLAQFKNKNPDLMVFTTTDVKGRQRIAAASNSGEVSMLPMHPPIGNDYLWAQKVRDTKRSDLVK